MRSVTGDGSAQNAPAGEAAERWEVAAIGPRWAPGPGETELEPVPGALELHGDVLVFRASDAVDTTTGDPLVAVIPASTVQEAGPLAPGTKVTPTQVAGGWMPGWQRRVRCPGFLVATADGPWVFDGPDGKARAATIAARYA